MPDLARTYGEGLARLVQVPTVTGSDRQNFVNFRKVLAEEFPAVYRVCDVIRPASKIPPFSAGFSIARTEGFATRG